MAIVSRPPMRIEPSRRETRPRIARRVLVRPAPLRPRRLTTSPSWTVTFTPCRAWLSPYQACRPEMSRNGFIAPSGSRAEIGGHHPGIGRDLPVGALRKDLAPLEHG